jgi:uncharacterized protein (TIGR02646 family)
MIYIDRNSIPKPKVFNSEKTVIAIEKLEEFYTRNDKLKNQQRFSQPFRGEFQKGLKRSLRKLFNEKCAYCESKINPAATTGDLDHFRPKSGARGYDKNFSTEHYWWLTYEWNNLYYSCPVCNRYKATWFPLNSEPAKIRATYKEIIQKEKPLLIDPCNDEPNKHLTFDKEGNAIPLTEKGKVTIEILKLNREDLVFSRFEVIKEEYNNWEKILKIFSLNNYQELKSIFSDWLEIIEGYSIKPYLATRRMLINDRLDSNSEIKNYFLSMKFLDEKVVKTSLDDLPKYIEIVKKHAIDFIEETPIDFSKIKSQVYLKSLELKNFKCFSELKIDFKNSTNINDFSSKDFSSEDFETTNALEEPWVVFLGENGVGKSSILQAISLCLMGDSYRKKLNELTPSKLLKNDETEGYIKLFLVGEKEPISIEFSNDKDDFITNNKSAITLLAGYGSVRVLPKNKIQEETRTRGSIKVLNLFDYSYSLTDAKKWLLKKNWSSSDFGKIALTLKDLLLLDPIKDEIQQDIKEKEIWILKNGKKESLEQQSDGYKTVIALAVDIMAFFMRENVSFELAEGIVLIDELGTHLHPRWKMRIVRSLRNAFPKLQFIVTTHEPLCLRGLNEGEVIVLTKDIDNNILPITELPDPSKFRVDQLLTSPFFGLSSAIAPETEELFSEYYALLAKEEKDRTRKDKERLLTLSDRIPKIKYLGDTLREELALFVIDELIAKTKTVDIKNQKIDNLKDEVKQRVEDIWNQLDLDNSELL